MAQARKLAERVLAESAHRSTPASIRPSAFYGRAATPAEQRRIADFLARSLARIAECRQADQTGSTPGAPFAWPCSPPAVPATCNNVDCPRFRCRRKRSRPFGLAASFSRRAMLQTASAGFGYLAFAGRLGARRPAAAGNPLRAQAAALPAAGQAGDLPVHARRPVAGRHVRLQAAARQATTASRCPSPSRGNKLDGQLLGLAVEVRQHGQSGLWARELLPARRRSTSTTCACSTACTPTRANHGEASCQLHTGSVQLRSGPSHRLVGHLRPGHREPEPARLRHDLPHAWPRRRRRTTAAPSCRPVYQGTPIGNADRSRCRRPRFANIANPQPVAGRAAAAARPARSA